MPTPPAKSPSSGGINVGDVGGDISFSALGDIVGGDKVTTITTTIQISVEAVTQRQLITTSPYRGLDRFEDRDAALFFGRDQLIKSLLTQLSTTNVLLVLGASGSGKSSVVRAGLLPRLSQLVGARFRYFTLVPDVNPFESLRSALQGGGFSQAQTRELLDAQPDARLIRGLQREGDQWLIFVDQFEEIFTVSDERLRTSFISTLVKIAQDPTGSIKLVLAMRADFFDRFSPFPQFAKLIEKNIAFVTDMQVDELRLAIEQPAAKHGVVFEQGLVEEIIKDVQGQAGSLPLLQYTLSLCWQEEECSDGLADRHLNTQTYRQLGGVRGALQKRADEIYASFADGSDPKTESAKQKEVRQIFLRVVDLAGQGGDEGAWRPVRRRVPKAIFSSPQEQEILQALIDQKLLVSSGRQGGDPTVEVAHEALFTSWGKLKKWIAGGKQVIFARNRLADDASHWQSRRKEDESGAEEELLSGSRLGQALEMRARGDFDTLFGGLSEMETQFLDASATLRDRRGQEEQERQQRELVQARKLAEAERRRAEDQIKGRKRQRYFIYGLAALALVTGVIAAVAMIQRSAAQERGRIALSRQLAAQARALINKRFDAAVLTALAGYRVEKTPEARGALLDALVSQPRVIKLFRDSLSSAAFAAALSPDGTTLFTAGCARYQEDKVECAKGVVQRWDTRSGQRIGDRQLAHASQISAIGFLNGGQRLVTASAYDGTLVSWDAKSLQPQPPVKFAEPGEAFHTAFSNDGRFLAIGNHEGSLSVWDVETSRTLGSPLTPFQAGTDLDVKEEHVKEEHVEEEDVKEEHVEEEDVKEEDVKEEHVEEEDVEEEDVEEEDVKEDAVASLAFSADGKWVAAGTTEGKVALIEVAQQLRLKRVYKAHSAWVDGVALNPSATLLASAGRDKKLRLWRIGSSEDEPIELAAESFFALSWSRDGKTLAAAGESGIRLWRMPEHEPLANPVTALGATVLGLAFDQQGKTLVANGGQGLAVLINTDGVWNTGKVLETHLAETKAIDFSSDGRRIALGGCSAHSEAHVCSTGGLEIWNLDGSQPKLSAQVPLGDSEISSVRYVPRSNRVRAAIDLRKILVSWDPSSNTPPLMVNIATQVRGLGSIFFSPDAQLAAVAGCGRFREETETYCAEGRLELWDTEPAVLTGGPWAVHKEEVMSATFSWDGKWMASGGGDGNVLIWDRAKGAPSDQPLRAGLVDDNTGSVAGIYRLAFSPNDQLLAGGTEQGLIVWNIRDRQTLFRIPHSFGIGSLAFSGDSRRIVFNGENELGDALVWDLPAGTYAFPPLMGLSTRNDVVALSADGGRLASADRSGHVIVWDLSTEEPDEWACRVLNRNPSQEEMSQLVGDYPVGQLCHSPAISPKLGHDRERGR
jgi:WD40 repeat protein